MYLVGAQHPNKARVVEILDGLIRNEERLITSVEVFQEILHRYTAIGRRDAIGPALEGLRGLTEEIHAFGLPEIYRAHTLIDSVHGISARDALHVAVMERVGARRILSFDQGFDACPWIERIH